MTTKRHDVLVLNRAWVPIHITKWQDAMSLVFCERVHSLDKELLAYTYKDWLEFSRVNAHDYNVISTIRGPIALPEIIVSTTFDRLPDRKVKYTRSNVFHRDKNRCAYCGKQFKQEELTIDHIKPREHGGLSVWQNVVASCFPCNQKKRNRTPEQANMKLKIKPHMPRWVDPLQNVNVRIHPCKSWGKFYDRVSTSFDAQNTVTEDNSD